MKKMRYLPFYLLLLLCQLGFAQNYAGLIAKADSLYEQKAFAQSVATFQSAFKLEQKNRSHLYNAGCSAALAGQKKLAFKWLNLALKNGWTNVSHLKSDTDLSALHGSKKWDKLVAAMQKEVDRIEANYDKPLQAELLQIFDEDQKYRMQIGDIEKSHGWKSQQMQDLWNVINEKDSINLLKIKAIIDTHGWVGPDKVGSRASSAQFLVIQHSDLVTQQHYLPIMREAVKNKKASGSSLALLEDRVALGEGRKQIYGSQIGRHDATNTQYVMPLEDPDNVDMRRQAVGLGPLADYVKRFGFTWDAEAYKKQLPEIEAWEKEKQNH